MEESWVCEAARYHQAEVLGMRFGSTGPEGKSKTRDSLGSSYYTISSFNKQHVATRGLPCDLLMKEEKTQG